MTSEDKYLGKNDIEIIRSAVIMFTYSPVAIILTLQTSSLKNMLSVTMSGTKVKSTVESRDKRV